MEAIPESLLPRKKAIEICKDVTGWRSSLDRPDYSAVLSTLKDYMARHAFVPENEVEVRIGHTVQRGKGGKKFVPGIGREMFSKVFAVLLRSNSCWERQARVKETDHILGDCRVTLDEASDFKCAVEKRQVSAIDVDLTGCPIDFRIGVAKETPVTLTQAEITDVVNGCTMRRVKDRQSFKYKHWTYDLTMVTHSSRGEDADPEDRSGMSNVTFEIEIEIRPVGLEKTDLNAKYLAESTLLKIIDVIYMIEAVPPSDVTFNTRPVKIRPPKKQ
jgi:hypothetical protein